MKTREETGALLRRLRGSRTLQEVAKDLGIAWQTLQSYENGTRTPRDNKKETIAAYYGMKITDIFF